MVTRDVEWYGTRGARGRAHPAAHRLGEPRRARVPGPRPLRRRAHGRRPRSASATASTSASARRWRASRAASRSRSSRAASRATRVDESALRPRAHEQRARLRERAVHGGVKDVGRRSSRWPQMAADGRVDRSVARRTEMAARPFVVEPKDYAPVLNIVGEHVTVLASGDATEGYEIFLQRGPEGSGATPTAQSSLGRIFLRHQGADIDFGIGAGRLRHRQGLWSISRRHRALVPLRQGRRRNGLDDVAPWRVEDVHRHRPRSGAGEPRPGTARGGWLPPRAQSRGVRMHR